MVSDQESESLEADERADSSDRDSDIQMLRTNN